MNKFSTVKSFRQINLRRIEPYDEYSESSEYFMDRLVSRTKGTWFGQFVELYVRYVVQNPMVCLFHEWLHRILFREWRHRILYPFVWKSLLPIFGSDAERWRPLVKLLDYVKIKDIETINLLDGAKICINTPDVFPTEDQFNLQSQQDCFEFPRIFVAKIRKSLVYGGTNLVFAGNDVVCHDLYHFAQDFTSEELHRRHIVDPKGRLRLLCHDMAPERIPVAATFVDACASNYAHWLTEVLPRITAFCSYRQFKNVPIIVNDQLHQNIMDSLAAIVGPNRLVILLPVGRAVDVELLYVTSVSGYVPFEPRNRKHIAGSHGVFSPPAVGLMRKRLLDLAGLLPAENWPKKIFIRRNTTIRKLTNAEVVEERFSSQGYAVVEPERLTFLQQVALFANANEVAAPTGAALASAIFCNPGTSIVVLMAKHKHMIYSYWLNLLGPIMIDLTYLLGEIDAKRGLGIHGDFSVSVRDVDAFLESRCAPKS